MLYNRFSTVTYTRFGDGIFAGVYNVDWCVLLIASTWAAAVTMRPPSPPPSSSLARYSTWPSTSASTWSCWILAAVFRARSQQRSPSKRYKIIGVPLLLRSTVLKVLVYVHQRPLISWYRSAAACGPRWTPTSPRAWACVWSLSPVASSPHRPSRWPSTSLPSAPFPQQLTLSRVLKKVHYTTMSYLDMVSQVDELCSRSQLVH